MKMAFMINAKNDDVMMMTVLMIIGIFSIDVGDDCDSSENVTFK